MLARVEAPTGYAISSAGDAIAIDMPMTVESVVAYLAIVLAGCVVVCIADSFSAPEITTRMRIAGAKAVFTQVPSLLALLLTRCLSLNVLLAAETASWQCKLAITSLAPAYRM